MTPLGIGRYGQSDIMPRHRHADGYIAVVLAGGYTEAGYGCRIATEAGSVVVHGEYAAHQDRFGAAGAKVLNLPLVAGLPEGVGKIDDVDMVARLAEQDLTAAAELLVEKYQPVQPRALDWPDLLAIALRDESDLEIRDWASRMRMRPASVSRGFLRAYGVTPKRFRLEMRTRRALGALGNWRASLAELAAEFGFADQAHLARSIRSLTGLTPARHREKYVQYVRDAAR